MTVVQMNYSQNDKCYFVHAKMLTVCLVSEHHKEVLAVPCLTDTDDR